MVTFSHEKWFIVFIMHANSFRILKKFHGLPQQSVFEMESAETCKSAVVLINRPNYTC